MSLPGNCAGYKTLHVADGVSLVLHWEDCESYQGLEQRIRLDCFRPVVGFDVALRKADVRELEAHYIAFPLNLDEHWKAWYDTGDLPVEYDAEQLPGVSRDYVTVGSYASMADSKMAVTLACPDAPMVAFGDFSFARMLGRRIERRSRFFSHGLQIITGPRIFAHRQPGAIRFHFEMTSSDQFDPFASALAGATARSEIEIHPLAGECKAQAESGVSIAGRGLLLLQAKLSDQRTQY